MNEFITTLVYCPHCDIYSIPNSCTHEETRVVVEMSPLLDKLLNS